MKVVGKYTEDNAHNRQKEIVDKLKRICYNEREICENQLGGSMLSDLIDISLWETQGRIINRVWRGASPISPHSYYNQKGGIDPAINY